MRHRLPLNLTLAAAVVVLSALLWFNQPAKSDPEPITPLERDTIRRVTIEFPDAATIRLERGESGWQLHAPVDTRAEEASVDQILRLAERESKHAMKLADVEPGTIGLDPPGQRVTFNDTTVALGARQPIKNRRYARVDKTVHLIDEPNMRVLNSDYVDLVARRLLPEDADIERLELPEATLVPTEQGGWDATPKQADRGADAAQKTVDLWKRTEALSVDPAKDTEPRGRVAIETAEHGTLTFEVLAREPQLLLRRPDIGVTFHVAGNRAAPLLEMRHPNPPAGDSTQPRLKNKPDIGLSPAND